MESVGFTPSTTGSHHSILSAMFCLCAGRYRMDISGVSPPSLHPSHPPLAEPLLKAHTTSTHSLSSYPLKSQKVCHFLFPKMALHFAPLPPLQIPVVNVPPTARLRCPIMHAQSCNIMLRRGGKEQGKRGTLPLRISPLPRTAHFPTASNCAPACAMLCWAISTNPILRGFLPHHRISLPPSLSTQSCRRVNIADASKVGGNLQLHFPHQAILPPLPTHMCTSFAYAYMAPDFAGLCTLRLGVLCVLLLFLLFLRVFLLFLLGCASFSLLCGHGCGWACARTWAQVRTRVEKLLRRYRILYPTGLEDSSICETCV
jgi:hypothetical protein